MKTVYLIFAEGKDGHTFSVMLEPGGPRWFEDLDEARKTGILAANATNTAKVWLVETHVLEELKPDQKLPATKKPEPSQRSDVHIFHELRAERSLPDERSCSGDECNDHLTGAIHSRGDLDALITALHGLGFQVSASRMTRTPVVEDPILHGREGAGTSAP